MSLSKELAKAQDGKTEEALQQEQEQTKDNDGANGQTTDTAADDKEDRSSSDAAGAGAGSKPFWRPLSTHKWTAQQRAKYFTSDLVSRWPGTGRGSCASTSKSSAPECETESASSKARLAKELVRRLSKTLTRDSCSGGGRSKEESAPAPTPVPAPSAVPTTPPPCLNSLAPLDTSLGVAFDEGFSWRTTSSSSSSSSSSSNNNNNNSDTSSGPKSSSSSSGSDTITGPESRATTPEKPQPLQQATKATKPPFTSPALQAAAAAAKAKAQAAAAAKASANAHTNTETRADSESWFRPCSESDKRAAKYLINNTTSTPNKDLAALVGESEARYGCGPYGRMRKNVLARRGIAEEDWERAILEEDEYEEVPMAVSTKRRGAQSGSRALQLRPDVRAKWSGLVVDQNRPIRQLPTIQEGLSGMDWDPYAWLNKTSL